MMRSEGLVHIGEIISDMLERGWLGMNIQTLQKGYWVALTLKAGAAPLRCYVGQIEAVDERGVRITLIDWLLGGATSWDFFVPWESITSAVIATPEHNLEGFGEEGSRWQEQCKELPV